MKNRLSYKSFNCYAKCCSVLLYMIFCIIFSAFAQQNNLKLWYNQPSGNVWEAALPLGNGRLAAMVYGNPSNEIIKLNESSVRSGSPSRNDGPDALTALSDVRKLTFNGKYAEASKVQ